MDWTSPWIWFSAAAVLGILELLAPAYVLLGFALAAALVGAVLMFGGPVALILAGSLPLTLVAFGAAALLAWVILRRVFGLRRGQVKIWDTDINDN